MILSFVLVLTYSLDILEGRHSVDDIPDLLSKMDE
jgi:hypothetical protein